MQRHESETVLTLSNVNGCVAMHIDNTIVGKSHHHHHHGKSYNRNTTFSAKFIYAFWWLCSVRLVPLIRIDPGCNINSCFEWPRFKCSNEFASVLHGRLHTWHFIRRKQLYTWRSSGVQQLVILSLMICSTISNALKSTLCDRSMVGKRSIDFMTFSTRSQRKNCSVTKPYIVRHCSRQYSCSDIGFTAMWPFESIRIVHVVIA